MHGIGAMRRSDRDLASVRIADLEGVRGRDLGVDLEQLHVCGFANVAEADAVSGSVTLLPKLGHRTSWGRHGAAGHPRTVGFSDPEACAGCVDTVVDDASRGLVTLNPHLAHLLATRGHRCFVVQSTS